MNEQEQTTAIALIKQEQKTMSQKIDDLSQLVKGEFAELKKDLKDNYVTKNEFWSVRVIVYGLVGVILVAFAGSLINQVIK